MLFFFRGRSGPLARAVVGVLFAGIGFAIHGGTLLIAIGVAFMAWAAIAALMSQRARRRSSIGTGASVS